MSRTETAAQIDALRSFNRLYTRRIGVLERHLLDSRFSLAEARVLYELAQQPRCTASDLIERLGMDAGYMSRLLRGFHKQALITRSQSAADSREYALALTAAGRATFRELDRRARDDAGAMLAALPLAAREDLLAGIGRARRALETGPVAKPRVQLRAPEPGDIGWAIERHGRLYADEFGWDASFEGMVAALFGAFATSHDPAIERCWIAEADGQRAGCVFVVRNADDPSLAQLRCLLVDPAARGLGIGRDLVAACIAFARGAGYRGMMLWTNDILVAARKLYVEAGFELVQAYPHHRFGHDLVAQVWQRMFTPDDAPDAATRPPSRKRSTPRRR